MPVVSPFLVAALRRHWPVIGALTILLALTVVHQFWFEPAAKRYRATLKQANELGMALDPGVMPAILPPRLFAVVMNNSLSGDEATRLGDTGTLTAQLLEEMTRMSGMRGMQVVVTEPGPISQQAQSVEVRAHIKVRCRYDQFVGLLEDMSKSGKLFAVDRFALAPDASGGTLLDLWASRLVLKREKRAR